MLNSTSKISFEFANQPIQKYNALLNSIRFFQFTVDKSSINECSLALTYPIVQYQLVRQEKEGKWVNNINERRIRWKFVL